MLMRYIRYFGAIPFVRDIVTMQTGKMMYIVMTFAASIAFARLLGVEGYGVYAVVLSFVATIKTFITLGQNASLQVFFAEEYGKKNSAGMAASLHSFLLMAVMNGLFLSTAALLSPTISHMLYGHTDIGNFARILFLYTAIDAGNSAVIVIAQTVRNIRVQIALEQSAIFFFLISAVSALFLGYGIWGIVLSQLAVSTMFLAVSLCVYRRFIHTHHLPRFREILRSPSHMASAYLRQSLWFSIDKNIGALYPSGLFFVMSLVAAPALVGIARIAMQIAGIVQTFLLPQINSLATTVFASIPRDDAKRIRMNAAKVIKHSLFFHAIVSFCAIAVLPFFIIIFYGAEYAPAIWLSIWLIVLALPSPLTILNSPLLRIFRKIHYSALFTIILFVIMWSMMYALSSFVSAEYAFLAAYATGQVIPLLLTAYIFMSIVRAPRSSITQ